MKHTDKYYINRIKKYLKLENDGNYYYTFYSRTTPREKGVRIEITDRKTNKTETIREDRSRENLYNEVKYYKDSGYLI